MPSISYVDNSIPGRLKLFLFFLFFLSLSTHDFRSASVKPSWCLAWDWTLQSKTAKAMVKLQFVCRQERGERKCSRYSKTKHVRGCLRQRLKERDRVYQAELPRGPSGGDKTNFHFLHDPQNTARIHQPPVQLRHLLRHATVTLTRVIHHTHLRRHDLRRPPAIFASLSKLPRLISLHLLPRHTSGTP